MKLDLDTPYGYKPTNLIQNPGPFGASPTAEDVFFSHSYTDNCQLLSGTVARHGCWLGIHCC